MIDNFAEILKDLGSLINVPLHVDRHGVCKIVVDQKFFVQIEHDPLRGRVLLVSMITEIPPGKFRENVLREALKANGSFPRTGTLAYVERNNNLSLHDYYNLVEFKIDKFAEYITSFIEKVYFWKTHIENGTIPSVISAPSPLPSSPFFRKYT